MYNVSASASPFFPYESNGPLALGFARTTVKVRYLGFSVPLKRNDGNFVYIFLFFGLPKLVNVSRLALNKEQSSLCPTLRA